METKDIISVFLSDFFLNKDEKICYITSSTSSIQDCNILSEKQVYTIDLRDNFSPLAPFLQILKILSPSKEQIEQFVYPALIPAFSGYIQNEKVLPRYDDFIIAQTFYEKQQCKNSICKLLQILPPKNFLIQNCQFLNTEAIQIIKSLENANINSKIIFSFNINETNISKRRLSEFFNEIHQKDNFLEIFDGFASTGLTQPKKELPLVFEFFDDFIQTIKNIRAFRAIDQQITINKRILNEINSFHITPLQQRQLLFEVALNFFTANDPNNASVYFNVVLNSQVDDEISIKSFYYLGYTYFLRKMNSKALKYASLVLQKLQNNHDSVFYAYALMLTYSACDRRNSSFLVDTYKKACSELQKHNLLNNYAYTLINVPTCYLDNLKILRNTVLPTLLETEDLIEKSKNEYNLAELYNAIGFIYEIFQEKDKAASYYSKSERLRDKIGEISFIIEQLNLFSYNYLTSANYKKAYEILKPFTKRFTELRDYASVTDTLRNLALPLFFSRNYKNAAQLLNLIIYILKLFNFDKTANNSYVPEINNILIYRTIIDIDNGDFLHAEFTFNNILKSQNYYSEAIKPLFYYIKATSLIHAKHIKEGLDFFEEGFLYYREVNEPKEHSEVFILYEFAHFLKKNKLPAEAKKYFQRGFEIAQKNNFTFYTKGKSSLTIEEFEKLYEDFGELNFEPNYIKSTADKEKITNDLHAKVIDSQFMNKIISISSKGYTLKKYIQTIIKSLLDYTASDAVYYLEETTEKWQVYSATFNNEKIPLVESCEYYFNLSNHRPIVQDKLTRCLFTNLSKFKFKLGIVILPNEKNKITLENQQTLNIIMSIIQNKIIMKKQQELMLQASTIDALTQMNNRATLIEHLENLSQKTKRLIQKKNFTPTFTICFIDLDNFKYYNDTFGHKAGDFMLKNFSIVLKNTFRHVDFLSRFGGDEFVIILPETPAKNAKILSDRIRNVLISKKFFIPELSKFLGENISVPENRYMTFSMGICSNQDIEDPTDLNLVITNADKAMYEAKQAGKNRCSLWKEK